jgi:hypothetical protein
LSWRWWASDRRRRRPAVDYHSRDACEFIGRHYIPERAIALVAGGISFDATIRMIASEFQRVSRRPPAPRREIEQRIGPSERRTFQLDVERPWVSVAWALPDARTPEGDMVLSGIRRVFFEDAERDADFTCARRVVLLVRGGEEMPIFALALELDDTSKLDDCVSRVWTVVRSLAERFHTQALADAILVVVRGGQGSTVGTPSPPPHPNV